MRGRRSGNDRTQLELNGGGRETSQKRRFGDFNE